MGPDRTIPIIVGITGHRLLRDEDYDALHQAVKEKLEKLKADYPNSDIVMLTSLAEGSDLLCAEVGKELGMPLIAALPMPLEKYEKDFSDSAKEALRMHCKRAEEVFVTPHTEAEPKNGISRDYLFRQAGIYVSSKCHILIALWDGGPGTKAACGTAEAVGFSLYGDYLPSVGVPLRTYRNAEVWHFFTPRRERCSELAGTLHVLGNPEVMRKILEETDEFNRQAKNTTIEIKSRLPYSTEPVSARTAGDQIISDQKDADQTASGQAGSDQAVADQTASGQAGSDQAISFTTVPRSKAPNTFVTDIKLDRMEQIGAIAGKLSSRNAKQYRTVLAFLAASGMILTFAFLMYDEAQAIWMILVCGVMLVTAWLLLRYATRSDCHRRYIEYRALAECLRVQLYLRYAGTNIQAADLLTWTQQEETAWIRNAVCALCVGAAPVQSHDIRDCWVEDQRKYHVWAGKRSHRDFRFSENVVFIALSVSATLYCAAVLFELLCGGLIFTPTIAVPDVEIWRTGLKIVLGTISAVTLFVASYYGKQSLSRTLTDHQKMERFYEMMYDQITRHGQKEELLTALAREELIENGNWCSYQTDNKPDINI